MTATAVRKRIPFLVEHPPGAELVGPVEYPGHCRCCKLEVMRHEVTREYLDALTENRRTEFVDKLCAVSKSGRVFFPRNCATCDRRGRDLEPTAAN